jgi:hypothetical protein
MTTYTTLHQDSTTVIDAVGAPKFRVSSSISYIKPGDLPYENIFVYQVVDPLDPKQDTFLRIATVHDLTIYLRGRDNAIANGKTVYLAASFIAEYSDVTTAVAAKAVIQTRIDTLIADWIKYTQQFLVPTDYTLPAPEDTLVAAATNAYKTSKTARAAKEAELATANATLATATTAATNAASDLSAAMAQTNACGTIQASLTALITAYSGPTGYKTSMNALVAAAHAAGWPTSGNSGFDAALVAADAAVTAESLSVTPVLSSIQSTIASQCAAAAAAVQAAATAKTQADTAVATAQTAQALAQAAATAAAAAEAAALAAALAVCPDFDPNA